MSLRPRMILFLLVAFLSALACTREKNGDIPAGTQGSPDEMFSDFVTQESDSGKVKWRLRAPRASKYNARKLIVMDNPTLEFFDEKGKLQTTLVSEKGEFYEDSQDMLAYGNVVVRSSDGDVLETDSLFWNDATGKIVSHSFVRLSRDNDVITGIGLECDHNLSSVNIKRNVRAKIVDNKGRIENE